MTLENNETKKNSKQGECKIDEDLYSRQLFVLGHDAMKEMMKKRILLIGLDGLGQEIAKNICLAGVKKIDLYDLELVNEEDLESGFYLNSECIGKTRSEAVLERICKVNRYVNVGIVKEIQIENYEIVICVNICLEKSIKLNEECRKLGVKFILADVRGVFSRVFCDLGVHDVIDQTGEAEKRGEFSYVDEEGIGTMADGSEHELDDGTRIVIDDKIYHVEVISRLQIRLKGYRGGSIRRGVDFEEIKETIKIKFKSLKECINNLKQEDVLCFENEKLTMRVHELFCGKKVETGEIDKMFEKGKGILISPMCSVMGGFAAQEVIKAASGKFIPVKQFYYFDVYDIAKNISKNDNNSLSIENDNSLDDKTDHTIGSKLFRYKGISKLFGMETFKKLSKMHVFLVGAGAIGCENIKNFVMSGIGKDGVIHITDMDMIEKSNLNRQFLFRAEDVGHSKSMAAAREAIVMNSDYMNSIKAYESSVDETTEQVFSDRFIRGLDIVTNALDNVKARNYMDGRCIQHCIPMFDAGTSGTKGHVQCVIPYLTESYQSTRDPETKEVPMCTIRLFPATIDHAISWSVELFKKLFELDILKINEYLESNSLIMNAELKENLSRKRMTLEKNILESTKEELEKENNKINSDNANYKFNNKEIENDEELLSEYQNEEDVIDMIKDAPITVESCINKALSLFINLFSTQIQSFLRAFPADAVRKDGQPFWAPPKRIPTPISFNINDKIHILFVETCANIYATCFKVRKITRNEIFLYLENVLSLCEPNPITFGDKPVKISSCETVFYDKDSWHVDFIYATSNIRARNFRIKEQSKLYIKGVSGKIVPAIATTTAIVSGLMTFEIIRHASFQIIKNQNLLSNIENDKIFKNDKSDQKLKSNIENFINKTKTENIHKEELKLLDKYEKGSLKYKNTFFNLSIPFLTRVDTIPPKINIYNAHGRDIKFTLWSSINLPDMTLQQLIDTLSSIWNKQVSAILFGSHFIYWNIQDKYKANLNIKISELANNNNFQIIQSINYITEDFDFEAESVNVIIN